MDEYQKFQQERDKRIMKASYQKERQIAAMSIWGRAVDIAMLEFEKGLIERPDLYDRILNICRQLSDSWYQFKEEFDNDYFQRLRERKNQQTSNG